MSAHALPPPPALTPEERNEVRGLRKRKMELIEEINQIKGELDTVENELENLYYVDDSSDMKGKIKVQGMKKFNANPRLGAEFLMERGLLERTPGEVAQFLLDGANNGLSKSAIGDYLGSNDEFNLQVLDEFAKRSTVTGKFLVDALRDFLYLFRLPGESQKIDRIMEKFAAHFCEQNAGLFDSPDTCFVLSYSCIMLNTLLHNPAVKDRPDLQRYAQMNKELLEKGAVSHEMLAKLFESIQKAPFKIPEDDSSRMTELFLHTEHEGWLYKQSSMNFISGPLSWKRRWFVLANANLYYFENSPDPAPRGIIPLQPGEVRRYAEPLRGKVRLTNVAVRSIETGSRPYMFEIYSLNDEKIKACKAEQAGKMIDSRHSSYRMCASSAEDLKAWIGAISSSIQVKIDHARPRSTH